MRLDGITIALRARSPWEATDLGVALVRRHAARIWAAWIALTLPIALAANALGLALDAVWVGWLVVWWLKPVFDRIPLYVLSRAVFGVVPSVRETIAAQARLGWRPMLAWLTWRRLHPSRALLLPVDLLEGVDPRRRGERVRVLSRGPGGTSMLLMLVCIHLEAMLGFSLVALVLLFVPIEFLSDSAKALWETLFEAPPPWAQVVMNLVGWITMSVIEPFYVGAGFGLYLNRRTQLEAWDIELSFRRIAQRLAHAVAAVLVVAACAAVMPARAANAPDATKAEVAGSLEALVGEEAREGRQAFADAVEETYRDPALVRKQTIYEWQRRVPVKPGEPERDPAWLTGIGRGIGFVTQFGLWILVAIVVALLVWRRDLWLTPLRRALVGSPPEAVTITPEAAPRESLPDDPTDAVLQLWDRGERRGALSLLYRTAVVRLDRRLATPLPPGATEADCLRRVRELGDEPAMRSFAALVARWRAAAYADRLPPREELDALLVTWRTAWVAPR